MSTDQFHALLRTRPFEPFDIHLSDGRVLAVDHPDAVAVSGGFGTSVGVAVGPVIELVNLGQVVSLEPAADRRPQPNAAP